LGDLLNRREPWPAAIAEISPTPDPGLNLGDGMSAAVCENRTRQGRRKDWFFDV
jgi:hypothetical protein